MGMMGPDAGPHAYPISLKMPLRAKRGNLVRATHAAAETRSPCRRAPRDDNRSASKVMRTFRYSRSGVTPSESVQRPNEFRNQPGGSGFPRIRRFWRNAQVTIRPRGESSLPRLWWRFPKDVDAIVSIPTEQPSGPASHGQGNGNGHTQRCVSRDNRWISSNKCTGEGHETDAKEDNPRQQWNHEPGHHYPTTPAGVMKTSDGKGQRGKKAHNSKEDDRVRQYRKHHHAKARDGPR